MTSEYGSMYYGGTDPWGTLALTETSPQQSFTEPLTISEVASYLRLPDRTFVDLNDDALILDLIKGARVEAELRQRRELVRKQWDLTLDYWPGCYVELLKPLVSVDLIQYRDSAGVTTTLTAGTDYIVNTAKSFVLPVDSWPTFSVWPSGGVLIRFTAGYAHDSAYWQNDGAAIKAGMRELISKWYIERLRGDANGTIPPMIDRALSFGARILVR
jgi:uncharacterized phiE125 gp8 family phage protein